MGTKKSVEWCFGYGEAEYEVCFVPAPRNGELSPSVPETPEPFNSPSRALSPLRTRHVHTHIPRPTRTQHNLHACCTCRAFRLPLFCFGYQESCVGCFGYGESEYDVSFGIAPRNGELSSSEPETPDILTLRPGTGTRNGVQIRTPRKIWVGRAKLAGRGIYPLR